ncbi:hypothetical protein LshimejAT787_1400010 [Lyophyllum shimeji]|uniref:Uncharacterized protein n=1 Tax=Lyophyllum shimeji TaxID=47721 RepID=A0A9P3PXP2_LYOSH|nr:hypothetical protein LshimejAT787_1400010 [Lyophyllum shimeji]
MYSTRATSGSARSSRGLRTFPAGRRAHSADSSFLHRRISDSQLIVAPQVLHVTIQFLQGKGSLDLFSLDLPLPASCESASVQGSPLQQNKSPRRSGKSEISAPRLPRIDIPQPSPIPPPSPLSMQPGSDVAPQDPATTRQEAWRRLTTIEARLEHQDGKWLKSQHLSMFGST